MKSEIIIFIALIISLVIVTALILAYTDVITVAYLTIASVTGAGIMYIITNLKH